ncbi:hypothetical protein DJ79_02630 [Halorubrum ezzemoulense]|uniref:Class I SAM-dependent methyltransferase n=1 Tax=Halorubrum ezzemoulense TaxID=337243 RepID=A0A256JLD9_HALEZ|nr:class I SAM-dependent methyltransferase [Halorubrum ezzemoulense]OYR69601.1 hypothetical protein DJ79_02630 [Halorubrum ezzemoulense]
MKSLRQCPLCDSESKQVKKHVEHKGEVFGICECSRCSFLYVGDANNNPTEDADQKDTRYDSVPASKARHRQIKSILDSELERGNNVVEIGAGYGALGKLLSKTGYDYLGFEPMPMRASVPRAEGIHVRQDVFAPQSVDKPIDALVIDNVLEHVIDPKGIVRDAVESLRTGGLLVVLVPNRYDIRRAVPSWREDHFWIPKWHINFFRARDLKRLFHEVDVEFSPFGFNSVEIQRTSDIKFFPKILLDKVHLYPFGLYCYGKKKE